MIKILVRIPDDIEDICGPTRGESCSQIFYALKSELEDQLDVSDAYIVDFQNSDAGGYILGLFEPGRLLDEVRSWNQNIIMSFAAAIAPLETRAQEQGLTISEALAHNDELKLLETDTPEIYDLHKSACAIDNHFITFGQCMNYLPNSCGYPYARTLIQQAELAQIEAEPENYAIISVCIK